jgi:hypothetical protein
MEAGCWMLEAGGWSLEQNTKPQGTPRTTEDHRGAVKLVFDKLRPTVILELRFEILEWMLDAGGWSLEQNTKPQGTPGATEDRRGAVKSVFDKLRPTVILELKF